MQINPRVIGISIATQVNLFSRLFYRGSKCNTYFHAEFAKYETYQPWSTGILNRYRGNVDRNLKKYHIYGGKFKFVTNVSDFNVK